MTPASLAYWLGAVTLAIAVAVVLAVVVPAVLVYRAARGDRRDAEHSRSGRGRNLGANWIEEKQRQHDERESRRRWGRR